MTITLSSSQLTELQNCLAQLNKILGLSSFKTDSSHSRTLPAFAPKCKRAARRITNATFTYRWLSSCPQRITILYQHLLRAQWIAQNTSPEDFASVFSGTEATARIKWTGTNPQLAYLIRVMTERNYISTPKATGKWTCVYNHFVGQNNRPLPKLNSLHVPQKSAKAIEQLADLLNPNT